MIFFCDMAIISAVSIPLLGMSPTCPRSSRRNRCGVAEPERRSTSGSEGDHRDQLQDWRCEDELSSGKRRLRLLLR